MCPSLRQCSLCAVKSSPASQPQASKKGNPCCGCQIGDKRKWRVAGQTPIRPQPPPCRWRLAGTTPAKVRAADPARVDAASFSTESFITLEHRPQRASVEGWSGGKVRAGRSSAGITANASPINFLLCAGSILVLIGLFLVPAVAPALLRAEHWAADWRTAFLSDRASTSHAGVAMIPVTEDS